MKDYIDDFEADIFKFLKAIADAEEKGEHEFVCPLCGGQAHWYRAESNNHLKAWCDECDARAMS